MWLVGALAALLTLAFWACWAGRPRRLARPPGSAADAAFRRHPAGRARYGFADDRLSPAVSAVSADWASPRGPDDDPEFLAELDRVIRGEDGRGEPE
jgi:hypothetical protein